MAEPEQVESYFDESVDLFIDAYKDLPRLQAVLSSWLTQADKLEDAAIGVRIGRTIDNGEGVQLDILGKLIGQERVGDDDTYRVFLRTRVRANRSRGQSADLIAVIALGLPGATFAMNDMYPASVIADVFSVVTAFADVVASILQDAAGAGIQTSLHFTDADDSTTFAYADGDVEQADAARGWSDPTGTEGGELIGAF